MTADMVHPVVQAMVEEVRVTRNHAKDVYDAAEFKVADMKTTVKELQAGAMRSQANVVLSQMEALRQRRDLGLRDSETAAIVGTGPHSPGPVQRVFAGNVSPIRQEHEKRVDEIMFAQITGAKPPRSIVRNAEPAIPDKPSYPQYSSRSRSGSPAREGGRHVSGVLAEVFKPVDDSSHGGATAGSRKGGSLLDEDKFKHNFKGWWA